VATADFSREVTTAGEICLVTLSGELDMSTAEGLTDWLVEVAGSAVVVDLSGLTFMDSSGISALVTARNRMTEDGKDFILTRPGTIVMRALEVVGLAEWLTPWDPRWDRGRPGVTPSS
jgi:anti-sigma B factor antagonist